MGLVFLNGGSPNYLGEVVTTETELLTEIKTILLSAGWSTHSDAISASKLLIMRCGLSNGSGTDYGYVRFKTNVVNINSNSYELEIKGDQAGNNVTVSGTNVLGFISGQNNNLWVTADDSSGCLALQSYDGTMRGVHFGFLDRIAITDTHAWMIGYLNNSLANSYVSKCFKRQSNWVEMKTFWSSSNEFTSINGGYQGIWDRYTTLITTTPSVADSNRNAGYLAYNGNINGVNNKPVMGEYYYIEGDSNSNNAYTSYDNNRSPLLYMRGIVKYATVGLASLAQATQIEDLSGQRYISCGDFGWQGFRIV